RAHLADLGGPGRRGVGGWLGTAIDLEHHAVGVGEEGAAERGQGAREERRRRLHRELRDPGASEAEPPLTGTVDRLGGPRDELERRPVALLARLAPGDEAVL